MSAAASWDLYEDDPTEDPDEKAALESRYGAGASGGDGRPASHGLTSDGACTRDGKKPVQVQVHDFIGPQWGQAIADGVYDLAGNEGRGSVGVDHDTAQFAAASVLRWWRAMSWQRFLHARKLMLLGVGGGRNSRRTRLWTVALQARAEEWGATGGVPLSARHEQVDQDRAASPLLHHQELARPAVGQLRDGRQPHRQHDDAHRLESARRPGHESLRRD